MLKALNGLQNIQTSHNLLNLRTVYVAKTGCKVFVFSVPSFTSSILPSGMSIGSGPVDSRAAGAFWNGSNEPANRP
jgi:hypothetical protein